MEYIIFYCYYKENIYAYKKINREMEEIISLDMFIEAKKKEMGNTIFRLTPRVTLKHKRTKESMMGKLSISAKGKEVKFTSMKDGKEIIFKKINERSFEEEMITELEPYVVEPLLEMSVIKAIK
jgi:hypothetical protein